MKKCVSERRDEEVGEAEDHHRHETIQLHEVEGRQGERDKVRESQEEKRAACGKICKTCFHILEAQLHNNGSDWTF